MVFPPWTKLIFGFPESCSTMYWAASIFLMATRPGPCFCIESEINLAASASAVALMTTALVSCSFLSTKYLALRDSYSATYLASIDAWYSLLNYRCVMETSSRIIPNSFALTWRVERMSALTSSLLVISWPASYCATTDFKTSLPIDGRTVSS